MRSIATNERLLVGPREVVRALVEAERALGIVRLFEELAGAEREPRGGAVELRHLRELAGVDEAEAIFRRRDAREALELGPRRLVAGIFGEDERHRVERDEVVVFLLLVELREPAEEIALLRRILRAGETRLDGGDDLPPIEPCKIHGLEDRRGARGVLEVGGLAALAARP